jgi:hypothetical protein
MTKDANYAEILAEDQTNWPKQEDWAHRLNKWARADVGRFRQG